MTRQTHYTTLGLDANATRSQVRDAYRRLARELHPDVNPDPGAAERFGRLAEAYRVLADEARRRAYDATLRAGAGATHLRVSHATPHYTWTNIATQRSGESDAAGPSELDELYDTFFGT